MMTTFCDTFLDDCRTVVDVIHGNRKISLGRVASAGSGTYRRDVSKWVIGYILRRRVGGRDRRLYQ